MRRDSASAYISQILLDGYRTVSVQVHISDISRICRTGRVCGGIVNLFLGLEKSICHKPALRSDLFPGESLVFGRIFGISRIFQPTGVGV